MSPAFPALLPVTPRRLGSAHVLPAVRSSSKPKPSRVPELRRAPTCDAPRVSARSLSKRGVSFGMREQAPEQELQLPSIIASPIASPTPPAKLERVNSDFDLCVACARQHRVPVAVVKACHDEFAALDTNKDDMLTRVEFEQIVRKMCHISVDSPTPPHLVERQWQVLDPANRGYVEFGDFFSWYRCVAFCEDLSSETQIDEQVRKLSKQHGFNVLALERVRGIYARYAEGGGCGCINKDRFKQILCRSMGLQEDADVPDETVRRYYREMDVNHDGQVDFEEFAKWYLSVHSGEA